MRNPFSRLFHSMSRSMSNWFRPTQCAPHKPTIPPEQLRDALFEMLNDPQSRRLLQRLVIGTVFPIEGWACNPPTYDTTASTPGKVAKFGTTCTLDQSVIFQDTTNNNNIGIGTTTPTQKLHVNGALRVDGALDTTSLGGLTLSDEGSYKKIQSYESEPLAINPEGNSVFIGTASGSGRFVVSGGTSTFLGSGSAPIQWGDTSSVGALSYSSSDVILRNQTANAIIFQTNNTDEKMRISNGGNVGIGTADRLSRLTVKGRASFTATGTVSSVAAGPPPTLTGSGTHFTTEVGIGDRITISGQTKYVVSITDDTHLTVDSAFSGSPSGNITVLPSLFRVDDSTSTAPGNVKFLVNDQGSVVLGAASTKQTSGGPELISAQGSDRDNVVLWCGLTSDTFGRFLFSYRGFLEWGPGGSGDQDLAMYRNGPGGISIGNFFSSGSGSTSTGALRVNAPNHAGGSDGPEVFAVDTASNIVRATQALGIALSFPTGLSATLANTGGSLTPSTKYYYVVTAVNAASQETSISAEVFATPDSTHKKIALAWTAVAGASSYNIYRTTVSGDYTSPSFLINRTTTSYTDAGGATTTGHPPDVPAAIMAKINSQGDSWLNGGKVGIGTTTPAATLDVSGAIRSTLTTVSFSTTPTFDASLGNSFKITLTGNITPSITNGQAGQILTLILCQDATGGRTVSWPGNLKLANGSITLSGANKCDVLSAIYDGTNWYEIARATNE